MATSIKYTGFVSGLVPLENNPECTVTVSVYSNKTELLLSKSTGISANNISLGQYRNSFTIPLKQIISNYNNSVLNYFYEGDLLDWNPSSIEITKTDYFGNEINHKIMEIIKKTNNSLPLGVRIVKFEDFTDYDFEKLSYQGSPNPEFYKKWAEVNESVEPQIDYWVPKVDLSKL